MQRVKLNMGGRCGVAVALAAALAGTPAGAQEERVTLRELMDRVAAGYPEVRIAQAELASAHAQRSLAYWTRRTPRLTMTGAFGVVPGARGTVFDSPDGPRDLDDLGPFWRGRLEFGMPVDIFGALGAAERAAMAGVASRDARLESRRDQGRLLAAHAYYGWLLAEANQKMLNDVRGHLDELTRELEEPSDDADPLDLFRARNARFHLDRLTEAARRGRAEAGAGLRGLVSRDARPAAEDLLPLGLDDVDLAHGVEQALAANAELREAEQAAEARAFLVQAARRERRPALGIEGRLEYGEAPGRARQGNPFVYDPFNVRSLSAAFGFRWDLSFKQAGARIAREQAEADAARARADALRERLRFDVTLLHARVRESAAVHETSRRALSTTASWLRVAEENHGLGTASTKDVVEAYIAYVQARSAHFQAVHDLSLAVIGWRLARGEDPLPEGENP